MERRWHATDRNATLAIDIIRRCAPASRISSCPQAPAPTLITHRTAQHSTGPSACSSSSSTTSAPCPRRVQTQSTKAAEELHIAAGDHSSRDQHYSRYLSRCHAAHAIRKSPARNTKSSWAAAPLYRRRGSWVREEARLAGPWHQGAETLLFANRESSDMGRSSL